MAIKLKLGDFDEGEFHATWDIAPEEIGLNAEHDPVRIVGRLHVRVDATLTPEDDVIVQAPLHCRIVQHCVRCLEEIPGTFDGKLTMLFSPRSRWRTEDTDASGEMPDPDNAFYDGDEIDLEEEITGYLLQHCDEYPLCREDCRGLDARTGANLNHEPAAAPTPDGGGAGAARPGDDQGDEPAFEPDWKRTLRELKRRA